MTTNDEALIDKAASDNNNKDIECKRASPTSSPPFTSSTSFANQVEVIELDGSNPDDELLGPCVAKQSWMHRFCVPKGFLFALCLFAFAQSTIVTGLVAGTFSSIERRYDLTSTEIGIISATYDSTVMFAVVFIGFYGGKGNIPRWLAMGELFVGIGAIIYALPQFISGKYKVGSLLADLVLCQGSTVATEDCDSSGAMVYLFMFAQVVIGIGASPLYTLGPAYIDDVSPRLKSPIYLAIFYAISAVGPAVGFVFAAQSVGTWVDLGNEPSNLQPSDREWVGAWWIGFVLFGILAVAFSCVLFLYPRMLPGTAKLKMQEESDRTNTEKKADVAARSSIGDVTEKIAARRGSLVLNAAVITGDGDSGADGAGKKLSEREKVAAARAALGLWSSLKVIMTNPTYVFNILGNSTEAFAVSAFAAFLPKAIESTFNMTASNATFSVGLIIVPGVAGGIFFGGWYMKHIRASPVANAKYTYIFALVSMVFMTTFYMGCSSTDLAGIIAPYGANAFSNNNQTAFQRAGNFTLQAACNSLCPCSNFPFTPVCGADGIVYFSPCHAGCEAESVSTLNNELIDDKQFVNCSCVGAGTGTGATAIGGKCEVDCQNLFPLFAVGVFLAMFFTFCNNVPSTTVVLRCLPEVLRPFGLSVQNFTYRILGTVPGPIVFGAILDSACALWEEECGERKSCWLYNNDEVRLAFLLVALGFKGLSFTFFYTSHYFFKRAVEAIPEELGRGARDSDDDEASSPPSKKLGVAAWAD